MYIVVLAMVPVVMALARATPRRGHRLLRPALRRAVGARLGPAGRMVVGPAVVLQPVRLAADLLHRLRVRLRLAAEPPRRRALPGWRRLRGPDGAPQLPIWSSRQWLDDFSLLFVPWKDKTDFGILRYLHFLALAYVALWLANPLQDLLRGRWAAPIVLVGQQALPVFMWSMALAWTLGMVLDAVGRDWLTVTLANLGGFATLVAVAALASVVKAQPWRQRERRVGHGRRHEEAGVRLRRSRPSSPRRIGAAVLEDRFDEMRRNTPGRASQFGHDAFVLAVLGEKTGGYFVEVGAGDGVNLSNTLSCSRRCSAGAAADRAQPLFHASIRRNRKAALETRAAYSSGGESVAFVDYEELSTLLPFKSGTATTAKAAR